MISSKIFSYFQTDQIQSYMVFSGQEDMKNWNLKSNFDIILKVR